MYIIRRYTIQRLYHFRLYIVLGCVQHQCVYHIRTCILSGYMPYQGMYHIRRYTIAGSLPCRSCTISGRVLCQDMYLLIRPCTTFECEQHQCMDDIRTCRPIASGLLVYLDMYYVRTFCDMDGYRTCIIPEQASFAA